MEQTELRILLNTTANTAGVNQTQNALRGLQQQVTTTQSSMKTASERGGLFANNADMLRFGTSLVGVNLGLNLASGAADTFRETLQRSLEAAAEATRLNRTLAASYGQATPEISRFADALARSTSTPRTDVVSAAVNARTLAQNYGLTTAQIETLIERTNDLAVANGQGLPEAFQRVQSAIRGEAESAEALGLVLNANFLAERQRAAGVRESYFTLTQAQQAQIIYTEFLRQSAQFAGTASSSTRDLDRSLAGASTSMQAFQVELGKLAAPAAQAALSTQIGLLDQLTASLKGLGSTSVPERRAIIPPTGSPLGPAEAAREAERRQQQEALRQRFDVSQLPVTAVAVPPVFRQIADSALRAQRSVGDLIGELGLLQSATSTLGTITGALGEGDVSSRARANATQAVQAIDQATTASAALAAQQRELQQQARILDPRDVAGALAVRQRLQLIEQLVPVERALLQVQQEQRAIADAITQSQAQSARVELAMLPARQELARLDREASGAQSDLLRLMRERTLLLAQQAAAPATAALEDTRAAIDRDRLVLANRRGTTLEERQAARREARDLTRNVLPGQELADFDARRQLDLVRRQTSAADLSDQLRRNAIGQRQAEIRATIVEPLEAQKALVDSQTQQLQLLAQITAGKETTIKHEIVVTINGSNFSGSVSGDTAADVAGQVASQVYLELTEANSAANMPQAIPLSGVRRVR